jgi:NAD(P)-dependent dehydrogenase (short-subunit alcohol dehydrogenase family)
MDEVSLGTGSASGLGRNIAEAVLESGDRLVATARDTSALRMRALKAAIPMDSKPGS